MFVVLMKGTASGHPHFTLFAAHPWAAVQTNLSFARQKS
jgi:hypothetical protein